MKFKVKSSLYKNNYDQIITLNLDNLKLIKALEDRWDPYDPKIINESELSRYINRKAYARYIGISRIDGLPIFEIDTIQLDREDKISQILK
jgi:hypothetical protein